MLEHPAAGKGTDPTTLVSAAWRTGTRKGYRSDSLRLGLGFTVKPTSRKEIGGVLVFLNLWQLSAELKETGSLGATESEV